MTIANKHRKKLFRLFHSSPRWTRLIQKGAIPPVPGLLNGVAQSVAEAGVHARGHLGVGQQLL